MSTRSIGLLAVSLVAACAAAGRGAGPEGRDGSERRHLVVTGEIDRDGEVELDPFLIVEARADPPAPPRGDDHSIDLLDREGDLVSRVPFGLTFEQEIVTESGRRVNAIDVTPFAITVELPPNVHTVRLRRGEHVLAERSRTPNPPVVAIVSAERREGEVEVRWRGGDADGDPLTYALSYSADGGAYESIALDLEESIYRFDAAPARGGGQERVRVVASDGFNTGEASFPVE